MDSAIIWSANRNQFQLLSTIITIMVGQIIFGQTQFHSLKLIYFPFSALSAREFYLPEGISSEAK